MRLSLLTRVSLFLFFSNFVYANANNLPLDSKQLEQLDAQQQQRQQALEAQQSAQLSAKSDVLFDKPPVSVITLPVNEQPCFQINKVQVVEHHSSELPIQDLVTQFSAFSSADFSYRLAKQLETSQQKKSQFEWAYQQAASELGLTLPHCLGNEGINVLMKKMQNAIIEKGYVTTRAVVGEQDLTSGELVLTVIPGTLRHTMIEDKSAVDKFTKLTAWTGIVPQKGDLLNVRDIEQSLENLKRVPTADATINIVPAEGEAQLGESDLFVQ